MDKLGKPFVYYRYKVAEWLHKAVNAVLFTNASLGWSYLIDTDDIRRFKGIAAETGLGFDGLLHDAINERKEKQKESIIYTLETDGYLERFVTHNQNGSVSVGFRLNLLGLKSTTILNDINYDYGKHGFETN